MFLLGIMYVYTFRRKLYASASSYECCVRCALGMIYSIRRRNIKFYQKSLALSYRARLAVVADDDDDDGVALVLLCSVSCMLCYR